MKDKTNFVRRSYLNNKVVFVDGFVGGGKTLICQIISSLDRVEMWVNRPIIEQVVGLYAHKQINIGTAVNLLNCCFDNEIYDQALLRNQNFRHHDHSSIFNYPKKNEYLSRVLNSNDVELYEKFNKEGKVLQFMTHGITALMKPIHESLRDRLIFCRLVRCPSSMYMLNHLARWSKRWGNESRNGMICNEVDGEKVPSFIVHRIDEYVRGNEYERAIVMLEEWLEEGNKLADDKNYEINEIPFEKFVFDPEPYINLIAKKIQVDITSKVNKEMSRQNVPRKSLNDAPNDRVFERIGWERPKEHLSVKKQIKNELIEMKSYLDTKNQRKIKDLVDGYVARYLDFQL